MDEQTRRERQLEAMEFVAEELEKLRMLKEHELDVRIENEGGVLYVRPVQKG
jgi:hypothetical protein